MATRKGTATKRAGTKKGAGAKPAATRPAARSARERALSGATSAEARARKTRGGDAVPAVSPEAKLAAKRIATRVLHVHYPASTPLSGIERFGGSLKPKALWSKDPAPAEFFPKLRAGAVFTYAGPSCFRKSDAVGDTVLFFEAKIGDEARLKIEGTPFDTGSLEPPDARLQPMARWNETEREAFVLDATCSGRAWRAVFEQWLHECYGEEPQRYLEADEDLYADGEPARTRPPELLGANGARGREATPGACADRRAWLWEVRFGAALPFERVERVLVPRDAVQDAVQSSRVRGLFPKARPVKYDPGETDKDRWDALYRRSGEIQRRATR